MAGNIVYYEVVPLAIGAAGGMFAGYYLSGAALELSQKSERDDTISLIGVPMLISANIALAAWLLPHSWIFGYALTSTVVPTVAWSFLMLQRQGYAASSSGGSHGHVVSSDLY